MFDLRDKKIWVAGHTGLVGSALCRQLAGENCTIITATRQELDLTDRKAVLTWTAYHKPDAVIVAAAKVGGIHANRSYPVDFLQDNLLIASHVIEAAHKANVQKLLYLGSSCIYPKYADQPITEDALLTGSLEPTNEAYAIAKIAGIKLVQGYRAQYGRDFISAMPCNLYGPQDRFDLNDSHVIPALLMKAHAAKLEGQRDLEIWGSGTPRREFLYSDDLADALIMLLKKYSGEQPINIGAGEDISIAELAQTVMDVVGLKGTLKKRTEMPDGTPRKLMNSSKIKELGWHPQTELQTGLKNAYQWYCEHFPLSKLSKIA